MSENCYRTEIGKDKSNIIIYNKRLFGSKEEQEIVYDDILLECKKAGDDKARIAIFGFSGCEIDTETRNLIIQLDKIGAFDKFVIDVDI